jgi:hypothetical protein
LVQVFRTSAAGQELVDADATDADGAFSLDGLAAGTYAIAASVDDYTPDYRLDVVVADVDGQREQVFAGAQALTLHPVTAVLLPQLARVEGSFYTRGDSVDLAVLPFGGVTGMRLVAADCNVDCSVVDFAGAPFVPHAAAASVALPDVDGAIAVFAQFEVRDTFVFTSPVFSTTIVRDTTVVVVDGDDVGGGGAEARHAAPPPTQTASPSSTSPAPPSQTSPLSPSPSSPPSTTTTLPTSSAAAPPTRSSPSSACPSWAARATTTSSPASSTPPATPPSSSRTRFSSRSLSTRRRRARGSCSPTARPSPTRSPSPLASTT